MLVRELVDKTEMLAQLSVLNELYPNLTLDEYSVELDEMLPHRYGQIAVFDGEVCVAISGFWIGNKLWIGKYLELDNIVVRSEYRSQGRLQAPKLFHQAAEEDLHLSQDRQGMWALDDYRARPCSEEVAALNFKRYDSVIVYTNRPVSALSQTTCAVWLKSNNR
jgi:hypothetical protein